MGYLYKFHVPVHTNRSIETRATLYDADNNVIMRFPIRAHGHRDNNEYADWPDFGNGDEGLNQFTSNGNTITGLVEVSFQNIELYSFLNAPELIYFILIL